MEEWLQIVIRQITLYSLPVVISLSLIGMFEAWRAIPEASSDHPFFALAWQGSWMPLLASIAFTRAVIIALPRPMNHHPRAAARRCLGHIVLCIAGWLMYAWALGHQPPAGLPPLHHWWAKVFMFFNLCMALMHLLPLPGMWLGEMLLASRFGAPFSMYITSRRSVWLYALLAASPLLDMSVGAIAIFPVYEAMADAAFHLAS
ncbi:MAG: hypothetical protein ACE5F3_00135 [Mariprofundaceae bacterium]